MRVLVSGDKHLGLQSEGMSRLEEQRRILKACIAALYDERPDIYVDLGDLFHTARPTPEVYDLALEYLCGVSGWTAAQRSGETARRAFVLAGNHDKPTRGAAHALLPLSWIFPREVPGVEIVDLPKTFGNLLFLPYVTEWEARERGAESAAQFIERFAEAEVSSGKVNLAFTHLEVPGSTLRDGDTVQRDSGLSIPEVLFSDARVLRTYAGHIHGYQQLERVTVVGSALHCDFGEASDRKGIVLVEV